MSDNVEDRKVFSLLEVTKSIQKTLRERYTSSYWVKAEMNKLHFYIQSGHCYPDLVEKKDGKVIAQIRANLWKEDYVRINGNFISTLKEPLKDGIKILFLAKINYDPIYGLALQIIDIDPSYTLGDLEKEKQETIKKLKEEGIFDKNKKQKLALLPQRIAIISVETSKGYSDFLSVIRENSWGYKFFHYLFPSLLQGEKAVDDMTKQLTRIKRVANHFDAVAIIRGGGGDVGLSCYNNLQLAREIATFPLPVFTGIGHSTNETVAEMISYYNAITPTKLAEFLIQNFHNFSVPVQKAQEVIIDKSRRMIDELRKRFQSEVKLFRSETRNILLKNHNSVDGLSRSLSQLSKHQLKTSNDLLLMITEDMKRGSSSMCNTQRQVLLHSLLSIRKDSGTFLNRFKVTLKQNGRQIATGSTFLLQSNIRLHTILAEKLKNGFNTILKDNRSELNGAERNIANMSPVNVLKRGYSITLHKGKAVKNFNQITPGDLLNTIIYQGNITSTVQSTNKTEENE